MLLVGLLLIPLAGGAVIGVGRWRPVLAWVAVGLNGLSLGGAVFLAVRVVTSGPVTGLDGALRADALSAFMVVVVGAVALLASWLGVRSTAQEVASGRSSIGHATRYGVLVQAFITTMLVAVLAANVGVLWVGIEATTVVTTFLVGHRRTRGALEASWKYIMICSVGIALAFLGTVLVYLAAVHAGIPSGQALDWRSLVVGAHRMDPRVMRMAFALVVLGYGTKVGLAPMHSWLPDAHGQAPAPVSALMSGVLLTVAFYAILRMKAVADACLGPAFPRGLLVAVALLSLVVAASLLVTQRDYKRMLAYSSIEHMGLIALGAAAGIPLAIAAVLLHILGHGLTKSVLFLSSGEIMSLEETSEIGKVRVLLTRRPALGGVFGTGLLALLGLPPFSLFMSELLMARAEFEVGLGWAAIVAFAAMAVVFVAVAGHAKRMLLGSPGEVGLPTMSFAPAGRPMESSPVADRDAPASVMVPLIGGLVACAAIGVLVWPLGPLLQAAARVVSS